MSKQTNYRKFVATAATATLVASAIVPVASANTTTNKEFSDVSGNYKVAVDYLYSKDILDGVTEEKFGTQQDIKRVDVAVMLAKALFTAEEIENAPASGFSDVPARATKYVNVLKANKIANGKTEKSFGAQDPITRGEAAIMLAKGYEITGDVENVKFSDVGSRYTNAVAALVDNNITSGKGDNKFGTLDSIKRGELAIFLYKLETLDVEEVVEGLEVVSVDEISKEAVNVTIKAAKEVDEEATVEVKNGKGNIVPVKTTVVEKGDTEVTFEFANKVAEADLDGVWTVNGVEYSFTAIKALEEIKAAAKAAPLNELKLLAALEDAGIKNVDEDKATAYAKELKTVETLADVQKVIDTVNEKAVTEAEKAAAAKAVNEAKSQTQLLTALNKFERVNKEWIVGYSDAVKGKGLNFDQIQEALDVVNEDGINTAIKNAEEALDSKLVEKATELVNKYKVNDEEDAKDTPKADFLAGLELHQAVINVSAETTNTIAKLDTALKALAELSDDIDVETVHGTLLQNYRDAIKVAAVEKKNTVEKLQAIIVAVNTKVAEETLAALNKVDAKTEEAKVVELLKNEALGLEGVVAGYAKDYKEAIIAARTLDSKTVQKLIDAVNDKQKDVAKLATINEATTATDMRDALTAASVNGGKAAYANLSSQAKLEVAELVLGAKAGLKDKEFTTLKSALNAIDTAMGNRTKFITAVNKATTITKMTAALNDKEIFPEFEKLSSVKKNEVAEIVLNALNEKEEKFTTIAQIKAAANL